ncbi:unnamed protein product [Symbiodinium pilosum]|uniref:Uncharacterized protein n=1 Tax=Symbiodinium pilosum TaxID=2952 RepID=A0A812KF05_SYMPI|nr:unnamed protein product [Symbiodinium pilosum]
MKPENGPLVDYKRSSAHVGNMYAHILEDFLQEASQQLAEEFGLVGSVEFRCQDALEADVSQAGLVWLNTYAWPADLKQRAVQKLLQELPPASKVVSYEPIPAEDLTCEGRELRQEASVDLEASWDPDLTAEAAQLKVMIKCVQAEIEVYVLEQKRVGDAGV